MVKEFKPYTETTKQDALAVVRERFPSSTIDLAEKVLRNPLRKFNPDAGTIGYRDGRPVCFQAHMLRRLYVEKKELFGAVGGMTCKVKKGCPLSLLLETIDRASIPRVETAIWFGNSCCASTAAMDSASGAQVGPTSCSQSLWRPVRPLRCLLYFIRRKLLKGAIPNWTSFNTLKAKSFEYNKGGISIRREVSVDPNFFNYLMEEYLKTNKGLVSSRTAGEIDWYFGDRIRDGRAILLTACKHDRPSGYVIVGSDHSARRWRIMDWFAVRNDPIYLDVLLKVACRYLRKCTPCFMLEVRGFPNFAQSILRRYLPLVQQKGVNYFSWAISDSIFPKEKTDCICSDDSWFFGPYDGDLVM